MNWFRKNKEEILVNMMVYIPVGLLVWFMVWSFYFSPLAVSMRELGL
jgi:hypothetical protein